jgi:hypothetical protein
MIQDYSVVFILSVILRDRLNRSSLCPALYSPNTLNYLPLNRFNLKE